eukprot:ctg_3135.g611
MTDDQDSDAVTQLMEMFPEVSRERVAAALAECDSDRERAAEVLLGGAASAAVSDDAAFDSGRNIATEENFSSRSLPPAVENDDDAVAAVQRAEDDEALARHLQAQYDREVAAAVYREERHQALRQVSPDVRAASPPSRPAGADMGEALDKVRSTVSGWWQGMRQTVAGWTGDVEMAGGTTHRDSVNSVADPYAGPPQPYTVLESEAAVDEAANAPPTSATSPAAGTARGMRSRWGAGEGSHSVSTRTACGDGSGPAASEMVAPRQAPLEVSSTRHPPGPVPAEIGKKDQ